MLTDITLLLILILLNGVFAMSEIAIVGSKRARLLQMAEAGSVGARHALTLSSAHALPLQRAGRDDQHRRTPFFVYLLDAK
jgi:CBS domain containing-hemolysin-like protein